MSERHISPPANGGVAQPAAAEIYRTHVEAGVTTVLTLGSLTTLHKFQVTYPGSFAKIETQHGQSASLAVPQLGSCASSGRAWRLWAARHSQEEPGPFGA